MKQIIKSLALAVLVAFVVTFFASIYMLSIVSIFKVDLNNVLVSVISMILSNITTIALYCMIKRKNFTVLIKEIKLHKKHVITWKRDDEFNMRKLYEAVCETLMYEGELVITRIDDHEKVDFTFYVTHEVI